MRFLLLNPNTSQTTTAMMLAIARETAAGAAEIDGLTAATGASVITDEPALAAAAVEVDRITATLPEPAPAGLIIAAFGDPGLADARARLRISVIGIAEAAIAEASRDGRRFAIVTTTPALDRALRGKVAKHTTFTGLYYTRSGPLGMADPARLHAELLDACTRALHDGASAIIIGGGPLAAAARDLRPHVGAALVEPIPAAIRALLARATTKDTPWPTP
jgi:Asp/Glu/hydantoin racemase